MINSHSLFLFSVVIDHAGNHKASTGKFECVCRQPMTRPIQTCKNSENTLIIKGIAIPSPNLCKINEKSKTVKRKCDKKENTKTLRNVECLNNIQVKKKIYKKPVLNLLQRLDSLFELAVLKKSVNRNRINTDSRTCACLTLTNLSLMREPENDEFLKCYYNLDVDRAKKTISYLTQTKSNPRIDTEDVQRYIILDKETASKMQIEPNAQGASDDDSLKSCSYKTDKMIYPYIAQHEPHVITKSDFGDHIDVTPIYAYVT